MMKAKPVNGKGAKLWVGVGSKRREIIDVNQFILIAALYSLSSGALAQGLSPEGRAAFRGAVEDYQIFVVEHCAPDDVRAYVRARAGRDQAFVRSLSKTKLKSDYDKAVADRAARDSHSVYECTGPPPPPGSAPPDAAQTRLEHEKALSAHFEYGDRQFAKMVQLRDRLIGSARR